MKPKKSSRIHPKTFLLWVGLASIVMMFAGLTSAYIVRRAQGNWTEYVLPNIFSISTLVVVLSSITMVLCTRAFKKEQFSAYKAFLGITFLLGLLFVSLQWMGWKELNQAGILLNGRDPSGAFLFVIAGAHALHVIGGIVILTIFIYQSFKKKDPVESLLSEMNPNRNLGINLISTYWHFVGILWVYLFFFLQYYR